MKVTRLICLFFVLGCSIIDAVTIDQTVITPESYLTKGSASAGDTILLTPAVEGQAGMILYKEPQYVAMGFTVTFKYNVTYPTFIPACADGWSFAIAPDGLPIDRNLTSGGGQGVYGLSNIVAYSMDTYDEEVMTLCAASPTQNYTTSGGFISCAGPFFNGNNGQYTCSVPGVEFSVQYRYPDVWNVSIQGTPAYEAATFVTNFTLKFWDIVKLQNNSKAYIGFTGSTGGVFVKQNILSWTFTSVASCSINNGFCGNATCNQLGENDISCTCSDGYTYDGTACTVPVPMSVPMVSPITSTPMSNNNPTATSTPSAKASSGNSLLSFTNMMTFASLLTASLY